MLTIHTAETLDDLADQCDPRTRAHLARLMLRTLASLAAREEWDHLPDLAEDLAREARALGLIVDTVPEDLRPHWEAIAESA